MTTHLKHCVENALLIHIVAHVLSNKRLSHFTDPHTMKIQLSARFCALSVCAVIVIVIMYLSQAEVLDRRIFGRYRAVDDQSPNENKSEKCVGDECASQLPDNFKFYRRFLLFQCVISLIGLASYALIRERQLMLDRKLIQKVNRQIAAGV
ncbi:hypothetical protein FGIG_10529 [Fasciola gigantica]|uniref:Uncharacterized protein n=1 Tax=Fasciola gigantica TaxID=46835 RepID=A0A504YF48_FASGI|nr:hypothetical protein FGIG_10529 [Fasciola gigantica]